MPTFLFAKLVLWAVAHQGADAVSGFDQVPDHFGSQRAGGASHKDER